MTNGSTCAACARLLVLLGRVASSAMLTSPEHHLDSCQFIIETELSRVHAVPIIFGLDCETTTIIMERMEYNIGNVLLVLFARMCTTMINMVRKTDKIRGLFDHGPMFAGGSSHDHFTVSKQGVFVWNGC